MHAYLMAINRNSKPGRPFSTGETTEKQLQVRMTPSQWQVLEEKRGDLPRSTFLKRLLLEAPATTAATNMPVHIHGRICAGDGFEIVPFPDGITVTPQWRVPMGAYALAVVGASMETPSGRGSIPDGSIAIFQKADKSDGSIVHVEWDDGGYRCAAIKRYVQHADGSERLESLNPDYEDLPTDREYTVCGIYLRAIVNEETAWQAEVARRHEPKQMAAARAAARRIVPDAEGRLSRFSDQDPQEQGARPPRRRAATGG